MNFLRAAGGMVLALFSTSALAQPASAARPEPPGAMVDLGGHRLHIDCMGQGKPAVIVEGGFEKFSIDWILVQSKVAKFTRVCTYDRAGYAWSEDGPMPRTFVQINLELHDALAKLGEHGPFVMVGHSFGGPIVRNFANTYPNDVAGIVFVDAVSEEQRFEMWHKAVLMRDGAKGKTVPPPHESLLPTDQPVVPTYYKAGNVDTIEPPFDRLPPQAQRLHLWAQAQRSRAAAEENERTWSPEYFANWHAHPESSTLGSIPLIVLTRAQGGFSDKLDIPAAQQEAERKQNQSRLAALSKYGEQRIVASGEDMQVEAPDAVVQAIQDVLESARKNSSRQTNSH
jgi:pimeloyl-ACP methyl ester carboxylesterase